MVHYTLYLTHGACSFATHTLLNELSIPHDVVRMKFGPDGQLPYDESMSAAEYRATIHPRGYVPVLVADGEVITEQTAILTFIASLVPEKNLLGKTELERVRAIEWMAWLSGMLHGNGYGMLYAPARFTDDESAWAAVKTKGRTVIEHCYEQINRRLEGREFPIGDGETTVDYNLPIFYYWGVQQNFDMSKYPNYGALMRRMEGKESLRATAAHESIKLVFRERL